MKQLLTKQEVADAIANLNARGKKITLATLHGALGNRGSMSTLVRLKAEIEAEAEQVTDSDALSNFREVWCAAVEAGRKQQEIQVFELRDTLKTLSEENERLDGLVATAETRIAEHEGTKCRAEQELHRVLAESDAELNRTKSALAEALGKLADAQAAHGAQVTRLQADLDAAIRKAHDTELQLARAQAVLEVKGLSEERARGQVRDEQTKA